MKQRVTHNVDDWNWASPNRQFICFWALFTGFRHPFGGELATNNIKLCPVSWSTLIYKLLFMRSPHLTKSHSTHSKGMDHYQKWFNWCFKLCCGRCFVTKIAVVFWPNFHSWWIFRSQWIGSWMLQSGLTFSNCCSCFAAIFACLKQHTSCMSFHMYTMFANQKAVGKHQDTDAKSADLFWGNVSGEVINQRHCL